MHLTQLDFALQHNVEILAHIAHTVQYIVAATVDDASGACEVALCVLGQVRAHLGEGQRREAKKTRKETEGTKR